MRKVLIVLGVPIDDLTMAEALDRLAGFVTAGRATGKCHQVATVNADFVVRAVADPELRGILQEVDMATADGMPLVWGARLLGVPLRGRVTGADLVPLFAERAAKEGYSLYFLGAAPGVAQRAAEILVARHPALKIAGVAAPPFGPVLQMDPAIADAVRVARPDVLMVAFGNPKQEKWIAMYSQQLGVPVSIGVGGTFDFIAGVTKRAPEWMQKTGLEWTFRLAQEPRRLWRRYVVDLFGFAVFFLRQWWAMRGGKSLPAAIPVKDTVLVRGVAIVNAQGRIDRTNSDRLAERIDEAARASRRVVVNLAAVAFLDSSALGTIVTATKRARDGGGEVVLVQPTPAVRRILELLKLDKFLQIEADLQTILGEAVAAPSKPVVAPADHSTWQVVSAPRRLDAVSAPGFQASARAAFAAAPRLIVDLSGTVFLASAGLMALIQLSREAQAGKGEFRLAGCSTDVLRVIQMVKLERVLPIFADVDEARSAAPTGTSAATTAK